MSDNVKSWIEKRRGIHATAVEGQWMDAYMNLPRALDALNKVLELHKPLGSPPDCTDCGNIWPCETVESIEGAINE